MHRNMKNNKTRRNHRFVFVLGASDGVLCCARWRPWLSFVLLRDDFSLLDSVKVERFCQALKTITNVNHQLAWKTGKYPLYHVVLFKLWHKLLSTELRNNTGKNRGFVSDIYEADFKALPK